MKKLVLCLTIFTSLIVENNKLLAAAKLGSAAGPRSGSEPMAGAGPGGAAALAAGVVPSDLAAKIKEDEEIKKSAITKEAIQELEKKIDSVISAMQKQFPDLLVKFSDLLLNITRCEKYLILKGIHTIDIINDLAKLSNLEKLVHAYAFDGFIEIRSYRKDAKKRGILEVELNPVIESKLSEYLKTLNHTQRDYIEKSAYFVLLLKKDNPEITISRAGGGTN